MIFNVVNKELCVGNVRIIGVASSAVFLIGDTELITLSSMFDTPPESVFVGPLAPLPEEES